MSFLVWVSTSQNIAQTQQNLARSHDRVIVAFRNSAYLSTTPTASLHLENINTKKWYILKVNNHNIATSLNTDASLPHLQNRQTPNKYIL